MLRACIDIGTNTTRLLVGEAAPGGLREVLAQRVFTRVGRAQAPDGTIAAGKLAEVAEVVVAQAQAARAIGCEAIAVVGTAPLRRAPNAAELCALVRRETGLDLRVLAAAEEARLAFLGATRALPRPPPGPVAVVDLGGGSTELAVGSAGREPDWWASVPVGSGTLAAACSGSDPPTAAQLAAVRRQAARAFGALKPPRPALAVAVGGSATSLRRLAGPVLDVAALEQVLRRVAAEPCAELARREALDPERVRLLPGAVVVLLELAAVLGAPLEVARGGLREGVILDWERMRP